MKISYNWLKQYIEVDLNAERVAEILTDTGLEIEGVEKLEAVKGGLEGVVIGQVVGLEAHGNADKLKVAQVDVGEEDNLQIVCGAPNIEKDQKVVVALVGSTLYPSPDEPFKIKKAKIRGVASYGMICAEDELGLGDSHAGIMVLEDSAQVGQPAADFFQLENDTILEVGLTPNRTDAMGHIGVARDLKAYLNFHHQSGLNLQLPEVPEISQDKGVKVDVLEPELCPDYRLLTIDEVEVKPSPEWLAKSLRAIGIQPKNNIVDVTNFVMHECGHPLHAFDSSVVDGNVLIRKAEEGEKLVTLDEEDRELHANDLLIANKEKPMCIAGVMGGAESGVKDTTNSVCLESAYFNPTSVRKSAKRHNIHSDASFRFERGANPEVLDWAMRRAAQLILETAGGKVNGGIVVQNPLPYEPIKVQFDPQRCRMLIGSDISDYQIVQIFDDLGMMVEKADPKWTVLVPGFRSEVTREADLIEEVMRIYGVNNIPLPEQMKITPKAAEGKQKQQLRARLTQFLAGSGWTEIMNNSLTSFRLCEVLHAWKKDELVTIKNPLSQELDIMRPDLTWGGLQALSYNINRKNDDLKFFEVGTTYSKKENQKFIESKELAFWMTLGEKENNWKKSEEDFFSFKSITEKVAAFCGVDFSFENANHPTFIKSVQIKVNDRVAGTLGVVHPKICKEAGVKGEVFHALLDWKYLEKKQFKKRVQFSALPNTLPVKRDFSLLVDTNVTFNMIKETISTEFKGSLLKNIELFDVYEGDQLPDGKKSYALTFTLQDDQKTLKDKVIDKQMDVIRGILEKNIGAELR